MVKIEEKSLSKDKPVLTNNTCSFCGVPLTTKEIMSKIMHIGTDDGSINCQEGKVYCEKCVEKYPESI